MWLANSKICGLSFVREEKYWNDSVAQMSTKSKWWPSICIMWNIKILKVIWIFPWAAILAYELMMQNKWCKKKFRNRYFRILKGKKFSIIHKATDASIKNLKPRNYLEFSLKRMYFLVKKLLVVNMSLYFWRKNVRVKLHYRYNMNYLLKWAKPLWKDNPFSSTILLGI